MSFLATAPDEGHPGRYPGTASSDGEAGPANTTSLTGVAALAGIAGAADMASFADGTTPDDAEAAPLVDPAALQDLGAGLDSPVVAKDFARDYIKMWARRYQSLAAALDSGDEADSLDAVLSLKISSSMVGGIRLSRLAGEIEDAIRSGDMDRARSFLSKVAEHGRETMTELQAGQDLPDT